jgi:hypothetical protein
VRTRERGRGRGRERENEREREKKKETRVRVRAVGKLCPCVDGATSIRLPTVRQLLSPR